MLTVIRLCASMLLITIGGCIRILLNSGCNFLIYTKKEYLKTLFVHVSWYWKRDNKSHFVSWIVCVHLYSIYKGKIKFILATVGGEITANYCTIISTCDDTFKHFGMFKHFVFVVRSSEVLFVVEDDVTGAKWNLAFAPLFRPGLSVGGN